MYPKLDLAKEDILVELENYQMYLDSDSDDMSDVNIASERLTKIVNIYSRASKIYTDFHYIYTKSLRPDIENIIENYTGKFIGKEVQKLLANLYLVEEQYIIRWSERMMSNCVHQMDSLRTLISKSKTEMQYLNFNNRRD